MKTITLKQAYISIECIKLPSVYHSISKDKLREDEDLLDTKVELILKVKSAEKFSGILELRDLIEVNKIEQDYFNTANSNLYYKENINKQDREYVKKQFQILKSERELLDSRLNKQLDRIRIEI